MTEKIISITEKVPQQITLPDGFYTGLWGGYEINMEFSGKSYLLKTKNGVRGMDIKVVIEIKNGIATFDALNS